MGTELRAAWTCATCDMTSRRPAEGAVPMPDSWDLDDDGLPRCKRCRLKSEGKAPERRRDVAGDGRRAYAEQRRQEADELAAAVRDALIRRAPAQREQVVAEVMEATGAGRVKVETIRRELRAEGRLPPAETGGRVGRRKRKPTARRAGATAAAKRLDAALRRDHRRPNAVIAAETRTSKSAVVAARDRLDLRWTIAQGGREETEAALARLGTADLDAVATELGIARDAARQRLKVLVEIGRAERVGDAAQGRTAIYRIAAATAAPA